MAVLWLKNVSKRGVSLFFRVKNGRNIALFNIDVVFLFNVKMGKTETW